MATVDNEMNTVLCERFSRYLLDWSPMIVSMSSRCFRLNVFHGTMVYSCPEEEDDEGFCDKDTG